MQLAETVNIACLMEATARKPGNVHPQSSFDDLCYNDFVQAATAIAVPVSEARKAGLGRTVLNSVQAVRNVTGTNVNLGIILLLTPLAMVSEDISLETGLAGILDQTSVQDAEQVYAAIRLAAPGGMGQVSNQDLSDQPTITLREAMWLAANRDRIAEQYVTNYSIVFKACHKLIDLIRLTNSWETAIVLLHLWIMSQWPDTLIARKCGPALAEQASTQAASVLACWNVNDADYQHQLKQFDAWLRSDGHRRNPGTTADLIAAALFAALRDDLIKAPTLDEIQIAAARDGQTNN